MSKFVSFGSVCLMLSAAFVITTTSGCAQKQLTAQEARVKYGSPYSRPRKLMASTKKKLPPVPIDPALLKNSSAPEMLTPNVLPASHTRDDQ